MGLFSFLKNAGSKIFGAEEAAAPAAAEAPTVAPEVLNSQRATALEHIVRSMDLPVENLDIAVDDDKVTVYGETSSQEVKEKTVLVLGNVEGIATVDDRISLTAPPAVFYEVKSGDTLGKIAQAHYGDAGKYPVIFEANKPMLEHPDKIYVGQVLRIPQA